MNMAWTPNATSTSFRALSTLTSRRKVIHEKDDPHPGCGHRADPVACRRLAGSSAIRTLTAGADGLPFGCRKIVLRTYRQAAADERLPQGEQGEAVGWLPQGGGIARRLARDQERVVTDFLSAREVWLGDGLE